MFLAFLVRKHRSLLIITLLLLVLTACASTSSPPSTGGGTPAFLQTSDGAFLLQLTVTPNHAGLNQFTVAVQNASTKQPVSHLQIQVFTTMLDRAMGTDTLLLQEQHNGTYSAQGDLSMSGHWEVSIELRGSGTTLHKAQVQLTAQA